MFSEVDISLNIRNNRDYAQTINIMGNPYNQLDTSNALTEYKWDITALVLSNQNTLNLEYKGINEASFTTFTAGIQPNIDNIIIALNSLGIGYFNVFTQLGNTYIVSNNDNYVFGNLEIVNQGGTTQVLWSVNCIGTTGNNQVQSGLFLDNEPNPYDNSSSPTPVPITIDGQTVAIDGVTSNQPTTKVKVLNQTTSTYIINDGIVGSGIVYSYSFQAYFGYNYLITIEDL